MEGSHSPSAANQKRGTIAFFSTYRPPVPLQIYSCPNQPKSKEDEYPMVDGETVNYNYNGKSIPPAALKTMLNHSNLGSESKGFDEAHVDSGQVSGLVFVSERTNGLETLHIAILSQSHPCVKPIIKVYNFAEVYGTYNGVRMEDSGCFAGGDYFVYVSTEEDIEQRRQPWTAVYRTDLKTKETIRFTPKGIADFSPSVSPSGKKIAVASLQEKLGGWTGEIQDLKTDIFVINVDDQLERTLVVNDGGWPTWGSDDVIFFHRKVGDHWGVFRADISNGPPPESDILRVTPDGADAMTPAAVDATNVAVAIVYEPSKFGDIRKEAQYRHVEVFDSTGKEKPRKITEKINPLVDYFNPFVIKDNPFNGMRIGYHRCHDVKKEEDFRSQLHEIMSPEEDIELCRAAGVFPTFTKDGNKLAFVDNEFKTIYVADYDHGLRKVYESTTPDSMFSPIWSQSEDQDILYFCMGPSFAADKPVQICAIFDASGTNPQPPKTLTAGAYNNAFPSTNPDGTRLVFRSTRDWMEMDTGFRHKNLYIMDAHVPESEGGNTIRLTSKACTDTHCDWSPNGKWIVFASTRDKPGGAPDSDNGLDPGYFGVYLVNPDDPDVVVRVIGSGYNLSGHVNHPFFSPDGKSIVVVADLAAVSADPMSMPLFLHSVRPYGDIFVVDIDPDNIHNNQDVKTFKRITHSRFENSTATWANVEFKDLKKAWDTFLFQFQRFGPICPYLHQNGGQTFNMTGHLNIPNRHC